MVLQLDFPGDVPNVGIRDQFTVYNIPKGGTVSDSSNPVPELTHFRKNIPDPTSLQVETDLTKKVPTAVFRIRAFTARNPDLQLSVKLWLSNG
jgi:hypothetical protein